MLNMLVVFVFLLSCFSSSLVAPTSSASSQGVGMHRKQVIRAAYRGYAKRRDNFQNAMKDIRKAQRNGCDQEVIDKLHADAKCVFYDLVKYITCQPHYIDDIIACIAKKAAPSHAEDLFDLKIEYLLTPKSRLDFLSDIELEPSNDDLDYLPKTCISLSLSPANIKKGESAARQWDRTILFRLTRAARRNKEVSYLMPLVDSFDTPATIEDAR